jgi:PPM family protein phosphatase
VLERAAQIGPIVAHLPTIADISGGTPRFRGGSVVALPSLVQVETELHRTVHDSGLAAATGPLPLAPDVSIDAAGVTDIGRLRSANEDAFLIGTLQRSLMVHEASPAARGWFTGEPAGTLLMVADGMGGQGGGDVAASTAINAVTRYLLNVMSWTPATPSATRASLSGVREQLSSALLVGDEVVKRTGARSGTPNMGTTLTMALVQYPVLYVAHVGDTRCYLLHEGKLKLLTTDHNLAQKLADDSPNDFEPAPHLQNILWNSLGATNELPQPQLCKLTLAADDTLMLCSDGLNKHVTDAELQRVLESPGTSAEHAAELVRMANAAGGTDNITVVVTRLGRAA